MRRSRAAVTGAAAPLAAIAIFVVNRKRNAGGSSTNTAALRRAGNVVGPLY